MSCSMKSTVMRLSPKPCTLPIMRQRSSGPSAVRCSSRSRTFGSMASQGRCRGASDRRAKDCARALRPSNSRPRSARSRPPAPASGERKAPDQRPCLAVVRGDRRRYSLSAPSGSRTAPRPGRRAPSRPGNLDARQADDVLAGEQDLARARRKWPEIRLKNVVLPAPWGR